MPSCIGGPDRSMGPTVQGSEKKGPPLVAKEPTPDQLIAMHTRVVVHALEPYGDFSILTPHGRRMQKRLKYRSWIPQSDGTYQPLEVPGPPSLDIWEACWGGFETILLMLFFQLRGLGVLALQALGALVDHSASPSG